MSKFRHALQNQDQHILTLRVICAMLVLCLFIAFAGWMRAPDKLTIHNPPDLRSGSTRAWWEVPPSTVYAFSFYIFQQLNAWPKDGEVDYPRKIASMTAYLTPSCQTYLEKEAGYRTTLGELKDRSRVVYEIPGRGFSDDKVSVIDRDHWQVQLDLVADEYFNAEPVKRVTVRYPVKVVRWEGDPERNPFGLALDCFAGTPQRLEAVNAGHNKGGEK